ncbi:hypothetical protein HanHA300_Chr01g0012061 [Helianthus annuus]|nr:hypothetical protein HanHA300_Chr01g0012061 [Helianthus annuus]KAJ0622122.1 hypothetical protein HanIR_Chr01g0016481 [Helianthus annuus]KAJ0782777.1 hypothetical protein HanLR1_Chr01g0012091 [Helianthus annuus]KAJ0956391.1 hypothetical protein HanPSC8_Chr01g0014241 [Helianthus annuus]
MIFYFAFKRTFGDAKHNLTTDRARFRFKIKGELTRCGGFGQLYIGKNLNFRELRVVKQWFELDYLCFEKNLNFRELLAVKQWFELDYLCFEVSVAANSASKEKTQL